MALKKNFELVIFLAAFWNLFKRLVFFKLIWELLSTKLELFELTPVFYILFSLSYLSAKDKPLSSIFYLSKLKSDDSKCLTLSFFD